MKLKHHRFLNRAVTVGTETNGSKLRMAIAICNPLDEEIPDYGELLVKSRLKRIDNVFSHEFDLPNGISERKVVIEAIAYSIVRSMVRTKSYVINAIENI